MFWFSSPNSDDSLADAHIFFGPVAVMVTWICLVVFFYNKWELTTARGFLFNSFHADWFDPGNNALKHRKWCVLESHFQLMKNQCFGIVGRISHHHKDSVFDKLGNPERHYLME